MSKLENKYWIDKIKNNKDKAILEDILISNESLDNFNDFIKIQEASDELKGWKEFDKDRAWNNIKPEKSISRFRFIKYAAVILVFISVGYFISQFNSEEIYYADNNSKHIVLNDGSDIVLYPRSELKISNDFNGDKRIVSLEGNAYFNIAKDKTKPFEVNMSQGSIKVLGTVFYVSQSKEDLVVDLISGKVELTSNTGNKETLKDGSSGTIQKAEIKVSNVFKTNHDLLDDLYFDNITINNAIDMINDVYGEKIIELEDVQGDLSTKTIHTTVKNSSVREFIKSLKIIFNVEVINSKGKFIIKT